MMRYLTVPALGVGSDADPIRPDLPDGTSWVGQHDPATNTYLVAVPDSTIVPAKAGRRSLTTPAARRSAIQARGLSESDVDQWRVG